MVQRRTNSDHCELAQSKPFFSVADRYPSATRRRQLSALSSADAYCVLTYIHLRSLCPARSRPFTSHSTRPASILHRPSGVADSTAPLAFVGCTARQRSSSLSSRFPHRFTLHFTAAQLSSAASVAMADSAGDYRRQDIRDYMMRTVGFLPKGANRTHTSHIKCDCMQMRPLSRAQWRRTSADAVRSALAVASSVIAVCCFQMRLAGCTRVAVCISCRSTHWWWRDWRTVCDTRRRPRRVSICWHSRCCTRDKINSRQQLSTRVSNSATRQIGNHSSSCASSNQN